MMNKLTHGAALAAVSACALLFSAPGAALAQEYEASLARGAKPDETPQQRYQTAIREAGGGLKIGLAECRTQAPAQRKPCQAEAQSRYKADMAQAREMLRNPAARPVNEVGEPVRSTETTVPIKP
ncbi:MAG: hypothetical protein PHU77_03475 [Simplicispira sp.]|nr:hypothetical protein [Simplicispira sp.]